jgi:transcriptional regulator with XRE-family HTH domain
MACDGVVRAMWEEGVTVSENGGRNPRQVFGAMVRFYREKAGLSRSELGERIFKSPRLVEAIELGQRVATSAVTEDLEVALDAGGALLRLREEIGGELGYQPYPLWFQEWTLKEAEAATLWLFEPLVVPGLLQTADYARAIFRTEVMIGDEEIDEQVAARLKRQDVLARSNPPMTWVVVDEGILRRQIGARHVMCEQLSRLADVARQTNVFLQVIPATVGAHRGLEGGFAIADFADTPSVGYREGAGGGAMVEGPTALAGLVRIWDTLRGEALPRAASLVLLEEAAKSWATAT